MPTADLDQLADWAEPLIRSLEPKARRALARAVARDLRRSQQRRIAAQKNPDGSAYEPRKPQPQLRDKPGAIRRKAMFRKIRTAKYLKAKGTEDAAIVGYTNRAVARIARVHQYGLRAKVDKDGPRYDYPERVLLGYTKADREMVNDRLIHHINEQLDKH